MTDADREWFRVEFYRRKAEHPEYQIRQLLRDTALAFRARHGKPYGDSYTIESILS